eukprot:gene36392-biopygen4126
MQIASDIQSSCDASLTILNDMLSYEKLDAGILTLDRTVFSPMVLLEKSTRPFLLQANEVGVDLQLLFTANTALADELIHGDFHRLSQVIRNLLSNALKFTPREGSVTVDAHCVPSESTDEGGSRNGRSRVLRVTVTDSGVGMSQENLNRLFKEIVQFSPGALQNGGGSGLGLWSEFPGTIDLS